MTLKINVCIYAAITQFSVKPFLAPPKLPQTHLQRIPVPSLGPSPPRICFLSLKPLETHSFIPTSFIQSFNQQVSGKCPCFARHQTDSPWVVQPYFQTEYSALPPEMKASKPRNLTGYPGRPALPGDPGLPLMPAAPRCPEKQ